MDRLTPEQTKVLSAAREYQRAYRAKNADRLREQKRAYYAERREHFREKFSSYRQENGDRLRAYDRWRRGPDGPQREKKREMDRVYRATRSDEINAKRAPYFAARKHLKREYDKLYRAQNADRLAKIKRVYYESNKPAFYARVQERNARELQATPKWVNRFFIEEAYRLADLRTRLTGIPWDVDHIVPLRSPLVCGLHVEHNLQVIPASVNRGKGNRHWPDMP